MDSKSPLKAPALRVPGQGITQALYENALDSLIGPFSVAFLLVAVAALEWLRYVFKTPPAPWMFTLIAVGAIAWAAWKIRSGLKHAKALQLGREGERAVAQYLEWFRTKDFFVFHDVPCGDSNIDHVLVGTRGVYAIETKTLSKPVRGDSRIEVSADGVRAAGRSMDRNPVVQAKASARWLYNFFADAQFKCFVQPVIVFPGWFVDPFDMKAVGVWALEPKALDGFIDRQSEVLTRDQMKAMASALTSYIRSQAKL